MMQATAKAEITTQRAKTMQRLVLMAVQTQTRTAKRATPKPMATTTTRPKTATAKPEALAYVISAIFFQYYGELTT
jgi:hypothetical protein